MGEGGNVTTNYHRGRAKEYKVMSILRSGGWVCSRSAMSHGPIDVFAAKNRKILVIQVKSGKARMKKQEGAIFVLWARAFGAMGELWQFKGRKGVERKVFYLNGSAVPLEIKYNGRAIPASIVTSAS